MVIFRLPANVPAKKPLRQHDITTEQTKKKSLFGRTQYWIEIRQSLFLLRLAIPMTPRAPHSILVSNLLTPTKHVNSDWVRVCKLWLNRKRRTLECGLHDVACAAGVIGEWEGKAPKSLIFSRLIPSLPLPFPDVFCESLFFGIKITSAVKRSRTVALSAERVLESLEQKGDGNDGMSSGEESDLYRQLKRTSDRSRYKLSCVTVLLRKHTMRFRPFYSQVLAIQSTTI